MKAKKEPFRTCVVTKEKLPKKELLRIVRNTDGYVVPYLTGKLNGRGAYIKRDIDTLNKAKQNKALEKALEVSISDEVYSEIEKVINN